MWTSLDHDQSMIVGELFVVAVRTGFYVQTPKFAAIHIWRLG